MFKTQQEKDREQWIKNREEEERIERILGRYDMLGNIICVSLVVIIVICVVFYIASLESNPEGGGFLAFTSGFCLVLLLVAGYTLKFLKNKREISLNRELVEKSSYFTERLKNSFVEDVKNCYIIAHDLVPVILRHEYLLREYYDTNGIAKAGAALTASPVATERQNLWDNWKNHYEAVCQTWKSLSSDSKFISDYMDDMHNLEELRKSLAGFQANLINNYRSSCLQSAKGIIKFVIPITVLSVAALGGVLQSAGKDIGSSDNLTWEYDYF